tara:strand:+ start:334 stop:504 length:171 start_codon:yes stop_codon:yes gene_type:complete
MSNTKKKAKKFKAIEKLKMPKHRIKKKGIKKDAAKLNSVSLVVLSRKLLISSTDLI